MQLYVGVKAVIQHEGKIFIIREAAYDEGTQTGKWDFPGGRIDPEETLHEGLAREVREEVGLVVTPGDVCFVQENFPVIKGDPCHMCVFTT